MFTKSCSSGRYFSWKILLSFVERPTTSFRHNYGPPMGIVLILDQYLSKSIEREFCQDSESVQFLNIWLLYNSVLQSSSELFFWTGCQNEKLIFNAKSKSSWYFLFDKTQICQYIRFLFIHLDLTKELKTEKLFVASSRGSKNSIRAPQDATL